MTQWKTKDMPFLPGYANTVHSNHMWNYVVIPKCASSVIIDVMNLKEGKNPNVKTFTFIRHPFKRLKSYMFQEKCFDIDSTNKKIESVLHNWDNNDLHCVAYSLYIEKQDFDFIGTLENFEEDFKNITDIQIKKMSSRDEDTKTNKMYNICLDNHSKDLSNAYAKDLILFNEVLNDNINNRSIH